MTQSYTERVLSLDDLVAASAWDKAWILALIDEAVIQPEVDTDTEALGQHSTPHFSSVTLTQVRRASRLRRDFDASPQAIGLILSLLDELRPLRQLQRQVAHQQIVYEITGTPIS